MPDPPKVALRSKVLTRVVGFGATPHKKSSIYNEEVFPQSYVDLVWKTSGQLFPSFRMCGQVKNLHGLFFSYPHISLTDFFPKFQGANGFSTNPQPLLLLLLIKLYLSHLYAC